MVFVMSSFKQLAVAVLDQYSVKNFRLQLQFLSKFTRLELYILLSAVLCKLHYSCSISTVRLQIEIVK